MTLNNQVSSTKTEQFSGDITVPGDKSISHRSLILASQAIGHSTIAGLLEGEDVLNTGKILQQCGVKIEKIDNLWHVDGVGIGGLSQPANVLDAGNSGTGVRLLMGLLATYDFPVTFVGDESLTKRPMKRVTLPLSQMGVEIESDDNRLPITLKGNRQLVPIDYLSPVASAQLKSCIMLAALNVAGKTSVTEQSHTRDHTERMLTAMGAQVDVEAVSGGTKITLAGHPKLSRLDFKVPADPSSAAFLVVAALIVPNAELTIKNVLMNEARVGVFTTLQEMGANLTLTNESIHAGEPVADIHVKYSALKGVNVPAERAPSMIDEYPILSVAASYAQGITVMSGLEELRVKESDRLAAIVDGLKRCGVDVKNTDDSIAVNGNGKVQGGGEPVVTHLDHRIAMSFLVMGMRSEQPVTVDDGEMIKTSFPTFIKLMNECGANIVESSC